MASNTSDSELRTEILERFAEVSDQIPVCLILVNTAGNIIACNLSAARFLQREKSQLIGKDLTDISDISEQSLASTIKYSISSRNPVNLSFNFLSPLGEQLSGIIYGSRYQTAKLSNTANLLIKIDESKKLIKPFLALKNQLEETKNLVQQLRYNKKQLEAANEELEDFSSQMGAIFDASVSGIVVINEKGIVQKISPSTEKILGWSQDEIVGKNVSLLMGSDISAKHDSYLNNYLETGKTYIIGSGREVIAMHKNGKAINIFLTVGHVKLHNNKSLFVGFIRDLTDIKHAESNLHINQLMLQAVIDATNDGVWDLHIKTGITEFSSNIYELTGYAKEEVVPDGIFFRKIVHPEDWERVVSARNDYLHGIREYREVEYRLLSKSGDIHWISEGGRVIDWDKEGQPSRMVGAFSLISNRKKMEKELLLLTKKAQESSVAKGQFVANMSHEIRTPLNSILTTLELMNITDLSTKQSRYVDLAYNSSKYLLSLLNNVLDYSKIQANMLELELKPFSLVELAKNITSQLMPSAVKKGLLFNFVINDDCPQYLIGDKVRISQILINLGSNAIKFTDQGKVTIHVSVDDMQHDLLAKGSVNLRFDVKDTGIGISDNKQTDIFKQFAQADASTTRLYGGSGLGLSIVDSLVRLMGNCVNLDSAPGIGSHFWFVLSLEKASAEDFETYAGQPALRTQKAKLLQGGLSGIRILSVEDNEINQIVIEEILKVLGAELDIVSDGEEAIRQLIEKQQTYDLILMDLQMPNMDGIECTRLLRNRYGYSQTPIVAMSANVQPSDKDLCFNVGMNDFLSKPISINDLQQTVMKFCEKKIHNAANPEISDLQVEYENKLSHNGFDMEGALERLGDNEEIYNRLAERYLQDIEQHKNKLDSLFDDLSEKSISEIRKTLHLLQGSALTLGAVDLADNIRQVQSKIKNNQLDNKDELLHGLNQQFSKTEKYLRHLSSS
jgi:two-component system sensor histidine kinase/response regulator